MTFVRSASLVLAALLLGACTIEGQENIPVVNGNRAPASAGVAPPSLKEQNVLDVSNEARHALIPPPAPSSVLYFITQVDGDGAVSYEIENGSWVTYWYGYQFELDGKRYFTGFAYETPEKFGKSEEESYPDPDAKVTLTQATYELIAPDSKVPWKFLGNQHYVGEFGGYEKGNEVDAERQPQSYRTPAGHLLLAVPTWYLSSGTRVTSFDLFVYNPHELLKVDDKRWLYLGNIIGGEDNSVACDEDAGGKLPCVKSFGTLSFVPQAGGDLPLLRVTRRGTEIEAPGKTRTLGPGDSADYHYDTGKKQYMQ